MKIIAHVVKEQIIPSLLVSKNNEMMKTNEMHMLDQNLHKNHLYSTFVLLPMIEQNIMIIDTEVEVPHEITLTTKIIRKIGTVLHLEIDLVSTKIQLLHNTLVHDMILTNVIPSLTALHTDPGRSRSHSNSRNKINMIQPQDQSDPIKFEVHMYHPTAMANGKRCNTYKLVLYSICSYTIK